MIEALPISDYQSSHYHFNQNRPHLSVPNTFCPSQLKDSEQDFTRSGSRIIEVVNINQRAMSAVFGIKNNLQEPRTKSDVLHDYIKKKRNFKKDQSILSFERVIASNKNHDGSHQHFQQNSSWSIRSSQKSNSEFNFTDFKRYWPLKTLTRVNLENWPDLIYFYFKKLDSKIDLIGFEFQSNLYLNDLKKKMVKQLETNFKHNKMFLPLKFVDQNKQRSVKKMIFYQKKGKFLRDLTIYEKNRFVTTLGKQIISVFKQLDKLNIQNISFFFLDLRYLLYDPKDNKIYFFNYLKIKESNVSFLEGVLNLLKNLKTFLEVFNCEMIEDEDQNKSNLMNKSHSKTSSNILNRSVVLANLNTYIEELQTIKDINFDIIKSNKPNIDDTLNFRHIILEIFYNQISLKNMDITREIIETARETPESHKKRRNWKSEVSQNNIFLRNSLPSKPKNRKIA